MRPPPAAAAGPTGGAEKAGKPDPRWDLWNKSPFGRIRRLGPVLLIPGVVRPRLLDLIRDPHGAIDCGDRDWPKKFFFSDEWIKHLGISELLKGHGLDWNGAVLSGGVERSGRSGQRQHPVRRRLGSR